ncbi:sodium:proton antiporter [Epibacterium sp. DP7N7-1]|nr:sodium:proton antiporter [Epibacterium sp. DP7N7-1]
MEIVILIALLGFIGYSMLSKAITRTMLTLPIVFVVLGFAFAGPIHSIGLEGGTVHSAKRLIAEITLVLVLFADASHVRFAKLRASFKLPVRMLVVGLPLTIALGTLVAYLLNPAAGIAMSLLTAAVLTPTDAALGQAVVSSPDVPDRIGGTINVESGLNDGLVLPFVLIGAIFASAGAGMAETEGLALSVALQIVLGPLVGIVVGWGVARALDYAQDRDWALEPAQGVVFLATAFATFIIAELIGGNGFIATFVAGMVFGNTYRHDPHFIGEFMEGAGQILTMTAFFGFGAFLLPDGLAHMTPQAVILAVCFLTFVRIVPIWLSLTGSGLPTREKLFLGWFGPRGLASILFTLIMMDEFDFPTENELLACVSMTVFLSVFLHGLSANPLVRRLGRTA